MRRVELLIEQSRKQTESTNYSEDAGIQDAEFIQYLNDGQDRVFARLLLVYPDEHIVEREISTTSGTASYPIPTDAFLRSKVKLVEYSPTGNEKDYYDLDQGVLKERFNGNPGSPSYYIRRGSEVLIQPAPNTSNGKIRFNYFQKLPRLDKRRGRVSSVTLDSSDNTITSLILDNTSLSANDITDIQNEGYLSIVDKDGNIKMKAIPVSSIDQDTGVVTLDGDFNYEDGETISSGHYIVRGAYATTHSYLDDACERYLLAHCDWKILKRDSSNDSVEQNKELNDILAEIVDAYKDADDDIDYVPILDSQYFDYE